MSSTSAIFDLGSCCLLHPAQGEFAITCHMCQAKVTGENDVIMPCRMRSSPKVQHNTLTSNLFNDFFNRVPDAKKEDLARRLLSRSLSVGLWDTTETLLRETSEKGKRRKRTKQLMFPRRLLLLM